MCPIPARCIPRSQLEAARDQLEFRQHLGRQDLLDFRAQGRLTHAGWAQNQNQGVRRPFVNRTQKGFSSRQQPRMGHRVGPKVFEPAQAKAGSKVHEEIRPACPSEFSVYFSQPPNHLLCCPSLCAVGTIGAVPDGPQSSSRVYS